MRQFLYIASGGMIQYGSPYAAQTKVTSKQNEPSAKSPETSMQDTGTSIANDLTQLDSSISSVKKNVAKVEAMSAAECKAKCGIDWQLDEQTEATLVELVQKKEESSEKDDFDTALRMKNAIDIVKNVSKRLAQLEEEKAKAKIVDDFESCKRAKREIDRIREDIRQTAEGTGDWSKDQEAEEDAALRDKKQHRKARIESGRRRRGRESERSLSPPTLSNFQTSESSAYPSATQESPLATSHLLGTTQSTFHPSSSQSPASLRERGRGRSQSLENDRSRSELAELERAEMIEREREIEETERRKVKKMVNGADKMTDEEKEAFGLLPKGSSQLREKEDNFIWGKNSQKIKEREAAEEGEAGKYMERSGSTSDVAIGKGENETARETNYDQKSAVAKKSSDEAAIEFENQQKQIGIEEEDAKPLTEGEKDEYAALIEIVGEMTVARLRSEEGVFVLKGLSDVQSLFSDEKGASREVDCNQFAPLISGFLLRLQQKKNASVSRDALALCNVISQRITSPPVLSEFCEEQLRSVVERVNDSNRGVKEKAALFVLFCSKEECLGSHRVISMLIPSKNTLNYSSSTAQLSPAKAAQAVTTNYAITNWRLHLERLLLMKNVIQRWIESKSSTSASASSSTTNLAKRTVKLGQAVPIDALLNYLTVQLTSSSAEVRNVSVDVFVMCAKEEEAEKGGKLDKLNVRLLEKEEYGIIPAIIKKIREKLNLPQAQKESSVIKSTPNPQQASTASLTPKRPGQAAGKGLAEATKSSASPSLNHSPSKATGIPRASAVPKGNSKIPSLQPKKPAASGTSKQPSHSPQNQKSEPSTSVSTVGGATPGVQNRAGVEDENADDDEEDWTYCEYCLLSNGSWTQKDVMEHQRKECPLLVECVECRSIVRVDELTVHLLTQCAPAVARGLYTECPRCHEAIRSDELQQHLEKAQCIPSAADNVKDGEDPPPTIRCPLCHKDISAVDDGWTVHLGRKPGCPQNPRSKFIKDGPFTFDPTTTSAMSASPMVAPVSSSGSNLPSSLVSSSSSTSVISTPIKGASISGVSSKSIASPSSLPKGASKIPILTSTGSKASKQVIASPKANTSLPNNFKSQIPHLKKK
eukprot:MONOS_3712.1-p1 / transcript=MONOS_3712.1 / gene=MONOS_3712 / organism=Monocercomonoides_exilis_PA203 / gene_product=unspecified product / transcript_product=unspecified product / location=Mono_scaffold00090:60853-64328(-) / protein_length=1103 / sequence_SO=supercontig / SO=protein_coding / is_pseudo=false